jgi:hypothetical protein
MALRDAGTGEVVASVNAIADVSLPAPTCVGLNSHVVSAGNLEQVKLTFLGNDPVVGLTSRLNIAGCPEGSDALPGVMPMVKSKVWLGVAVNVTGAECVIELASVPTPVMLKL